MDLSAIPLNKVSIVLDDSELLSEPVAKPKKPVFKAISLNTLKFDFNREEANVR